MKESRSKQRGISITILLYPKKAITYSSEDQRQPWWINIRLSFIVALVCNKVLLQKTPCQMILVI